MEGDNRDQVIRALHVVMKTGASGDGEVQSSANAEFDRTLKPCEDTGLRVHKRLLYPSGKDHDSLNYIRTREQEELGVGRQTTKVG
jgi:hypothetical protein